MAYNHSEEYEEYLNSITWKNKRKKALARAGYECEACNANENLEVHHLTYERFGYERQSDLKVLCKRCHEIADNERRWRSRINGWALKAYGSDWESRYDFRVIEKEFKRWLKAKKSR